MIEIKKQKDEAMIFEIKPLRLKKSQYIYLPFKRLVDILVAFCMLVIWAPFFLIIALAIKLDSPGPVFFRQARAGKCARAFKMYKFRSMEADAEKHKDMLRAQNESEGPFFKIENDPRITRVGRFLRKYSIDELPQFINVLFGQMSLVGPRPALYSEIVLYTPEQRKNLAMKPGLTCYWQVAGRSTSAGERLALDAEYITKFNPIVDFMLLMKTPVAVLKGEGAY